MLFNTMGTAVAQVLLKLGVSDLAKSWPFVLLGIAIYGLAMLVWLFVLSKADLSFAYSLVALTFVFLLIFSRLFLHETLSALRLSGAALIIVGIFLVARS